MSHPNPAARAAADSKLQALRNLGAGPGKSADYTQGWDDAVTVFSTVLLEIKFNKTKRPSAMQRLRHLSARSRQRQADRAAHAAESIG
ncbi:MAG: hypothetical protein OXE84_07730 [Rhodobacteraceae bacterium]|nr:hypothetical protein [Paracoccaceae bacterium]MCY4195479.1 hypothetical protein [Paracoccaceae bacterium]MCY4340712.1 hypothetical protein [Gammaproteobacteria bacterium]